MSQDSVEIIGEFTPKKATKKSEGYGSSPTTSTPVKHHGEGTSSQSSPQITLSQDVSRRPNKYFASPTRSPSKKTSPVLTKYSPFRKNSPSSRKDSPSFKHIPISTYFKRTPEKTTENPLDQVFKSVKKAEKSVADAELFESLMADDLDLSQVEVDEKLLTPSSKVEESGNATSNTNAAQNRPSEPEESSSHDVNNLDEEEDIFKEKKFKKKIRKALFPGSKASHRSESTQDSSSANHSTLLDVHFEDPADVSAIVLSQSNNDVEDQMSQYNNLNKENLQELNVERNASPQSKSNDSFAYPDSYSVCIEAALSDCLSYLRVNKERGIFVDLNELEKFTANGSLHQTRRRLYARLLINRQFKWYRVKDLKNYESALNLTYENLVAELNHLEDEGFLTSNLDELDLRSLLNLLQVKDLKQLCKFIRISDNKTKPELIEQLVKFQENQSVLKFFNQNGNSQRQSPKNSILMKRTKELLGHCIKLCEGPRNAFFHCLIFATYPYFSGDPNTRLKDYLDRVTGVQKNELSFPPYSVTKTVVFTFERLFLLYREALDLNEKVFSALNFDKKSIDWDKVAKFAQTLFDKLTGILKDDEVNDYLKSLPTFLHRFTAGHIYARTLLSILKENKKNSEKNFAVKALNLLLNQNVYLNHKRGSFYEELSGIYQNYLKNNTKALEAIICGLKDPKTDALMKHTLSTRGAMLSRRKTNPVPPEMRAKVEEHLVNIPEPTSVTIKARCLQGKSGFKQVYITETDDGVEFSSVEEVAKSHYRKFGFVQVLHDEGSTLRSLIFACFWDIIYQQPPSLVEHSVFHSPFQSQPLDWGYYDFFLNRRTEILARVDEMKEGKVEKVMELLTKVCEESENVSSVVNWNYLSKTRLNLLKGVRRYLLKFLKLSSSSQRKKYGTSAKGCYFSISAVLLRAGNITVEENFITALSVKVLCDLSLHLLQNVRLYGKAFPDLTMWDPVTKKCMFVEVKSPNDRLSDGQKLWLYNLSKMGALAEVCHIQATGSRKRKLITEASCSSNT